MGFRRVETMIKFVYNQPALLIGDSLVLADLHIGRETSLIDHAEELLDITGFMIRRIEEIKRTQASVHKLVILGDVKEDIVSISTNVHRFFSRMCDLFETVTVVKGNHDNGIENVNGVRVVDRELFIRDKNKKGEKEEIVLMHGHTIPSAKAFASDFIVLAHRHFYLPLLDRAGKTSNIKVYVIAPPNRERLKECYRRYEVNENLKVLFIPAFNPLIMGQNVLKSVMNENSGFGNKLFKLNSAIIYTLEGICLGDISLLVSGNMTNDKVMSGPERC